MLTNCRKIIIIGFENRFFIHFKNYILYYAKYIQQQFTSCLYNIYPELLKFQDIKQNENQTHTRILFFIQMLERLQWSLNIFFVIDK